MQSLSNIKQISSYLFSEIVLNTLLILMSEQNILTKDHFMVSPHLN